MASDKSNFEGSKKTKKVKEKKHKILLVDDEQGILDLLKYNLEKEGFIVYCCNNGRSALEVAKQELPDLVLLDVMMPEMDGMETCYELRQMDKLKNIFDPTPPHPMYVIFGLHVCYIYIAGCYIPHNNSKTWGQVGKAWKKCQRDVTQYC